MKINVMGAGGQLGRKVLEALLDKGVPASDLVAGVRTEEKAKDLSKQGIRIRRADYDYPGSLKSAFQGTEILVLIPSLASVEQRIQQHFNALMAALETRVKRVVFSSLSTAVPGSAFQVSPFFLYAESKLRLSGLDWTILRNNLYIDPVAEWMPELAKMGRLPYPVKHGRVAYISREDLGRATAAACVNGHHSQKIYELTGPESLSMPELAEAVSHAVDKPVRFDSISEEEYAEICRQGDAPVPESMIKVLNSLYRAVDNNEFATVTDHVEELTGSPPEKTGSYLKRNLIR
jgi:NAD(P)H dehydrogenase (quinone)